MGRACDAFSLISSGDRIMVAISGGKDSYTLLHLLRRLQAVAPIRFELVAVHLDQGQPGFQEQRVATFLASCGVEYRIIAKDTYSIVVEKTRPGQATCFLCSRMRRGILYKAAIELGCSKIALGHHRDDAVETLFLNLFFSGQLKSMPAKLFSDDGQNVVIRPLIYAPEELIARFSEAMAFPIAPCVVCESQKDLQRKRVKTLLAQLEAERPGTMNSLSAALRNVRPEFLLDPRVGSLGAENGAKHEIMLEKTEDDATSATDRPRHRRQLVQL